MDARALALLTAATLALAILARAARPLAPCRPQASQHPNWCGNLLFWSGVLVLNAQTLLSDLGPPRRWPAAAFLAAACSPLFLLALFYGQASGALTNTVELAERRYGADPAFHEYVASTPLIMPTPQSLARLLG